MTTNLRQAAEMALKYFEDAYGLEDEEVAIKEALRQALAYPEQNYVIDCPRCGHCCPERQWVGLTRRELDIATLGLEDLGDCYIAIESKLREKNDGLPRVS